MNGSTTSPTATNPKEERRKYYEAFNRTMVDIWKEKIILLNVIRTGALYNSVVATKQTQENDYTSMTFEESFNMYGIYVNYGVGSNTWRGNPGDIGRDNPRKKKPWFSKKYFRSVMNIREFMADNLAKQTIVVFSTALSATGYRRYLR